MTFANSTRSAFRFWPILWSGLAVLMLHSVHTYAGHCPSAQCQVGGTCCVNQCLFACIQMGVQQGTSSCLGDQACCMPNGTCQDGVDGLCCDEEGGVAAGPGTSCADFGGQICSAAWGCCNPNHSGDLACPNHNVYTCVTSDEGDPILGVSCDPPVDSDGDDVHDLCDPCPNSNPDDADGDGICGAADNCPNNSNPLQEDCDNDGIGDACDNDIDGDGVFNFNDVCDYTPVNQIPPGKSVNADGTLPGDLDGDCDVDANDLAILNSFTTGSGTCTENNNTNQTDDCCDHCACGGGGLPFQR